MDLLNRLLSKQTELARKLVETKEGIKPKEPDVEEKEPDQKLIKTLTEEEGEKKTEGIKPKEPDVATKEPGQADIKKLTEEGDEDFSDVRDDEEAIDDTEDFRDEEPGERDTEPEAAIEENPFPDGKEYFGKKEDLFYYIVGIKSDEGDREDLQILDQEEKMIYSTKEKGIDISDTAMAIAEIVKEIEMEDISFDVFMKYILPKLEEEEEPEEEFGEEEENFGREKEEFGREEEEEPFESKKTSEKKKVTKKKDVKKVKKESIMKTKITFNETMFDISISENVITINDKKFPLTEDTIKFYHLKEDKDLKFLANDMLRAMSPKEIKGLTEGYGERGKRDGTGPYKSSAQRSVSDVGIRKQAGEECPADAGELSTCPRCGDKFNVPEEGDIECPHCGWRPEMQESEKQQMEGYKTPGKRTGTGPAKGSYQRKKTGSKGKRKLAGEKCPVEKKGNETKVDNKESIMKTEKNEKKIDEDLSGDVKELQNSAMAALKEDDYIKAAELVNRLSAVQGSVGDVTTDTEVSEEPELEAEVEAEMAEPEADETMEETKEEKVDEEKIEEMDVKTAEEYLNSNGLSRNENTTDEQVIEAAKNLKGSLETLEEKEDEKEIEEGTKLQDMSDEELEKTLKDLNKLRPTMLAVQPKDHIRKEISRRKEEKETSEKKDEKIEEGEPDVTVGVEERKIMENIFENNRPIPIKEDKEEDVHRENR